MKLPVLLVRLTTPSRKPLYVRPDAIVAVETMGELARLNVFGDKVTGDPCFVWAGDGRFPVCEDADRVVRVMDQSLAQLAKETAS
jgi:hypothetical protein